MKKLGTPKRLATLLLSGGLAITSMFSAHALGAKHALLVGVSDYPHLPQNLQLDGPTHDAEIVSAVLRQRGFSEDSIQQLLTQEGYTSPTRQNILNALEALANKAQPDDFFYLHFAGHGSRQPASQTSNDEADGLDEIFLPTDAKRWNSYIGSVENAILDDEIALYVNKIRDKGADVWVIFDSCHSGTMTRGAAMPEIRYRRVDSNVLGIPEPSIIKQLEARNRGNSEATDGGSFQQWGLPGYQQDQGLQKALFKSRGNTSEKRGQLIAFSAAQSTQTTPEMKLPRGDANRRFHGLFTYTLMDVLSSNTNLSYQQLAQQVLARYQTTPWRNSTPLFSASDMSSTVFGGEGRGVQQFNARMDGRTLNIQGGSLAMLTAGSEVAIFADALAKDAEALTTVTLNQAGTVTSTAKLGTIDTQGWPKTLYARLIKPAVDFSLNVTLLPSKSLDQAQQQKLAGTLEKITKQEAQLTLSAIDEADILVSQFDGQLWFLQADQTLPCDQQRIDAATLQTCLDTRQPQRLLNMPLSRPSKAQKVLKNSLLKIANAERLLESNQRLPGTQQQLEVSFQIQRGGETQDLPLNTQPTLKENDQILFRLENTSRQSQDVSILFIDSQYGITQLYPSSGQPNRLQPGEKLSFEWHINVETVGTEHLLLSSQPSTGVNSDLSQLEQPPLHVSTRGLGGGKPPASGGLEIYSWQVSQ